MRGVRRRWRVVARGACALATAGQAACQAYTPIDLAAAPRAAAVRVELSAAASDRLAPALGSGVASLDGRVAELARDTLRLVVSAATLRSGQSVEWAGERVALGLSDVAGVRRRRPSRVRAALLGAALLGGAVLAARQLGADGGEGRGGGLTPVPR